MTPSSVPAGVANLDSRRGTVTAWDDRRGWGEITDKDGIVFPLHCTGIADGTRTIDEGATVTFQVAAGRLGRWEAWAATPAS